MKVLWYQDYGIIITWQLRFRFPWACDFVIKCKANVIRGMRWFLIITLIRSIYLFSLQIIVTRYIYANIDGLMQERHNSIAKALELCLPCANPSIWEIHFGGGQEVSLTLANIGNVSLSYFFLTILHCTLLATEASVTATYWWLNAKQM